LGSSTESVGLSISRLLFLTKADDPAASHAARNVALASSRLSATPPFGPCGGDGSRAAAFKGARRGSGWRYHPKPGTLPKIRLGAYFGQFEACLCASGFLPATKSLLNPRRQLSDQ
jgi:hypothetical protein